MQVDIGVHHLDNKLYQVLSFSYTFGSADIRKFMFQVEDGFLKDIDYGFGCVFWMNVHP